MNDRRRGERHTLAQPGMGTMNVIQDVEITYLDTQESIVIASRRIPRGERLLLSIPDRRSGETQTRLVRAISSRLVLRGGALRREVRLVISPRDGEAVTVREPLSPGAGGGALMRRVPVRIVEVSYSGCLWESPSPLDEGTVGFVDLRRSGQYHTEAVRILRTIRANATQWPFRMAVEFLTLAPLSPDSLRGVAAMVAVAGSPLPAQR